MMTGPFAHTLPGQDSSHWESLPRHLDEVADLTARYAGAFNAEAWGRVLGACHDLGKLSNDFQGYLRSGADGSSDAADEDTKSSSKKRVDHSTYGARFVASLYPDLFGQILAHCIAGHHAGLPNDHAEQGEGGSLRGRLDASIYTIPEVVAPAMARVGLKRPFRFTTKSDDVPFQIALFTRMLFSCLVDADRTCTEGFCNPDQAAERAAHSKRPTLADMLRQLDASLDTLAAQAKPTVVNQQRATVLAHCRAAMGLDPGFFSLNVPTGGGKTLSSLAFALGHAVQKSKSRIIVAIPFTSIIEQTAAVYRDALGPLAASAVVEHHTSLEPAHETRANQMGAENWDAPLIVTTNIQLLESLFACRGTPCRKLHHLVNSVIVLDEAQTIPVEYLKPVLAVLQELVFNYGCTIVLCTATQPALEWRGDFEIGLKGIRPIVPDVAPLFHALRRVEVKQLGKVKDEDLVERLIEEQSALCIVNTKKHAARLFTQLSERSDTGTCFHLSTWMCGAHRRAVLAKVRERLRLGLPCRLVSTQLVEAGVDVDFPAVFRAEAGFDSIAQAAGRCNREGKNPLGYTYVFQAEDRPPKGMLLAAADTAYELRHKHPDPLAPNAVEAYFKLHYWTQKTLWDKEKVLEATQMDWQHGRALLQFREVAKRFVLIRESTVPLLVRFDAKGEELWDKLFLNQEKYVPHRLLQPYLVSVPKRAIEEIARFVTEHESGVYLLHNRAIYDDRRGLNLTSSAMDAMTV